MKNLLDKLFMAASVTVLNCKFSPVHCWFCGKLDTIASRNLLKVAYGHIQHSTRIFDVSGRI